MEFDKQSLQPGRHICWASGPRGVALLGPLGVGPLSWLNRRKSIRRPDREK